MSWTIDETTREKTLKTLVIGENAWLNLRLHEERLTRIETEDLRAQEWWKYDNKIQEKKYENPSQLQCCVIKPQIIWKRLKRRENEKIGVMKSLICL